MTGASRAEIAQRLGALRDDPTDVGSPRKRVLLVVDFKNQLYRATSAHQYLTAGRTFTGGLYGFIGSMCRAIEQFAVTSVAVATDSPPYLRKEQFTDYKGDRAAKKDEAAEIISKKVAVSAPLVKAFLEVGGIPFWEVKGHEYDDICAWAVKHYGARFDSVVAMTNDSDLYQLFYQHPNFVVSRSAKEAPVTLEAFRKQYPDITSSRLWVKVLSLTGTHNAVPGVGGIAMTTALKRLRDPKKWRATLIEHCEVMERNRGLIELPHAAFPSDPGLRLNTHRAASTDVARWLDNYDVRMTASMATAFKQLRGENVG